MGKQPQGLPLMVNIIAFAVLALLGLGMVLAIEAFTAYELGEAGWGLAGAVIGGIVNYGGNAIQIYMQGSKTPKEE